MKTQAFEFHSQDKKVPDNKKKSLLFVEFMLAIRKAKMTNKSSLIYGLITFLALSGVCFVTSTTHEELLKPPGINQHTQTFESKKNNKVITFPILHSEHIHQRRKLEGSLVESEENLQVGSLYQGYGTHYVDLWVGSPIPQRRTVIIDTGSQITAFPCMDCQNKSNHFLNAEEALQCVESDHFDTDFNRTESKTFQDVPCDKCSIGFCSKAKQNDQCEIRSSYVEGSNWMAYEATDIIYLGNAVNNASLTEDNNEEIDEEDSINEEKFLLNSAFQFRFACQTKISNTFKKQLADGIMGLDNERGSFWHQMHNAGVISNQQFSICLAPKIPLFQGQDKESVNKEESLYQQKTAGSISFGGIDESITASPVVYSQMFESMFYTVQVTNVYFQKPTIEEKNNFVLHKISLEERNSHGQGYAIVDSGATETYLSNIKQEFETTFKQMTGFHYRHEFDDLTKEQLAKLPTIILQLRGLNSNEKMPKGGIPGYSSILDTKNPFDVILVIPPHHYIEYSPKAQKYVSRIVLTSSPTGNDNIIGSNILQGYNILFDMDNDRIGWALSSCDFDRGEESRPDITFEFRGKYLVVGSKFNSQQLFLALLGCVIFILIVSTLRLHNIVSSLEDKSSNYEYEMIETDANEEKAPLVVV